MNSKADDLIIRQLMMRSGKENQHAAENQQKGIVNRLIENGKKTMDLRIRKWK